MASNRSGTPINGNRKDEESSSPLAGPESQVPLIDDSVIVDDDGGLPFISAVYSLATDDKTKESVTSDTLNSRSSTGSTAQIINLGTSVSLNSSSVIKSGTSLNDDPVSLNLPRGIPSATGQGKGRLTTQNLGNNTIVNRTLNESSCSSQGTTTSESQVLKTRPQITEAIARTASTVTSTASNLQSAGNMSHLVRLVNSVSNANAASATSSMTSTKTASGVSLPPPVKQVPVSPSARATPVTHLPRQIAMKQPSSTVTSKQTSIVLNLKPGEAIPKMLNLLGPDGKSVVVLTLSDGGKQLVSPTGAPNMGGKVVIPIPANVAPSVTPKIVVNKVYPIAPLPAKTTVSSPQASVPPRLLSVSGSSLKPPAVSIAASSTTSSSSASVSNFSQTRLPVVSAGASGSELGSRIGTSPATTPTNVRPLEPKPSSSTVEQSPGLSPQEARIQRLKELIKRQEEAVNKLREKRRLEIDRIRDPSLTTKPQDNSETEDSLKSERVPLAEQKRPSSPFAVPLPPKKRIRDNDSSFKSKAAKVSDTSATPSDGAFIPNGDDKSFVQLVGLENVVHNIK